MRQLIILIGIIVVLGQTMDVAAQWKPGKVTVIRQRGQQSVSTPSAESSWIRADTTITVSPDRLCPLAQFAVECRVPSAGGGAGAELQLLIRQGDREYRQRVVSVDSAPDGWISRVYSAMPESVEVGEAEIMLVGPDYTSVPVVVQCVPWLIPPVVTAASPEFLPLNSERALHLHGGPFLWDASLAKSLDSVGRLVPYSFHLHEHGVRGIVEGQRPAGSGRIPFHVVHLSQGRWQTSFIVVTSRSTGDRLSIRLPADIMPGSLTVSVRSGWLEVDQSGTVVEEVLSDPGVPISIWVRS